jgi:hypothetical protein
MRWGGRYKAQYLPNKMISFYKVFGRVFLGFDLTRLASVLPLSYKHHPVEQVFEDKDRQDGQQQPKNRITVS